MIPVDNSSNFGQYEPNIIVKIIIFITRNIGTSWFSKRLIFLFLKKTRETLLKVGVRITLSS